MTSSADLLRAYQQLRCEGQQLAGELTDLVQRATVFHHLFEHSGRNHIFPLIAAHGALWAKGYFEFGMQLGNWLRWTSMSEAGRTKKTAALHAFADAFREINRRVCVDTYASYHFTRVYGDHPQAGYFVEPSLLASLNEMHAARRINRELPDERKRDIFERFFLNEQEYVVGPAVQQAVEQFDWRAMRFLAMKPVVRFAFFPRGRRLWFSNFTDRRQRVANGIQAFDWGARVVWESVEIALKDYGILPCDFLAGSADHFQRMRSELLAAVA